MRRPRGGDGYKGRLGLAALAPVALVLGPFLVTASAARAATIIVDSTAGDVTSGDGACTLREAIRNANDNGDTTDGDCAPGVGHDFIELGSGLTYILDTVDYIDGSANGLPPIASRITINGNGSTLRRDAAAPEFRFLTVEEARHLTLNDVTLEGGAAHLGGAINNLGRLEINNGTLRNNTAATNGGGALRCQGPCTLTDCVLSGNSALFGGAIHSTTLDALAITRTSITENTATGGAGGALNGFASTTITDSLIRGNATEGAFFDGGGIEYKGLNPLRIIRSIIDGNSASGRGGGIDVGSSVLQMEDSVVSGNSSGSQGGGISLRSTSNDGHEITNSTISTNSAAEAGGGIAALSGDATVALRNATLTENSAGDAGGILVLDATVITLENSILAGNLATSGPDCSGMLLSAGYTLLGNDSGCSFSSALGDMVGTGVSPLDPMLDILADNGGLTWTHALVEGSPAIDGGRPQSEGGCQDADGLPLTVDQRGEPRPVGDECDAGAYELGCFDETYTTRNEKWDSWSAAVEWTDVLVGNFDGLGGDDLAGRTAAAGNWWVATSTGTAFQKSIWDRWSPTVAWQEVRSGDFDGDGDDDLVGRDGNSGEWWVGLSDGGSFDSTVWARWSTAVLWLDVRVGDFDGDGLDDLVGRAATNGNLWVALSNGARFTNQLWGQWDPAVSWVDVAVGDLDGDGRDDLVGRDAADGSWWVARADGMAFTSSRWGAWSTAAVWLDVQVADFDDDGDDDIAGRSGTSGNWWIAVSLGDDLRNELWGGWAVTSWEDVRSGRFDCNDRFDIIGRRPDTGRWWVELSGGNSFETEGRSTWSASVSWLDSLRGDFDGDGIDDLAGRVVANGNWWVSRSEAVGAVLVQRDLTP